MSEDRKADLAVASKEGSCVSDGWRPIETAPRDGRRLLMTDGAQTQVCYPKCFPRPLDQLIGEVFPFTSRAGDTWEYFRDEEVIPGHSWSMEPTHWMPLPEPPASKGENQ